MNILEAYDLTGSLRDAAELAGCSHHTVARYVAAREQGRAVPGGPARRPGVIDEFLPKLEELVERSKGKIRADKAHGKITAMGYRGVGPHDPAGGRRAQGGLAGGTAPGAPAVDSRVSTEIEYWLWHSFSDVSRRGGRVGGAGRGWRVRTSVF